MPAMVPPAQLARQDPRESQAVLGPLGRLGAPERRGQLGQLELQAQLVPLALPLSSPRSQWVMPTAPMAE